MWALALLTGVLVVGTVGYLGFGFGFVDAMYQTVTTVATVGFREVQPLSTGGKFFTMALILVGVSSTLYAFSILIETLIEGRLLDSLGRRRMGRTINSMQDHVIICGWGRVGRSVAAEVNGAGRALVVVENDPERLAECPYPSVVGDATLDAVLASAGIEQASSLIAAVDVDAANSFIISERACDTARPVHRRPGPGVRQRGEAPARRRRPGSQPAAHWRRAHGRVRAPPTCGRVRRRRHA